MRQPYLEMIQTEHDPKTIATYVRAFAVQAYGGGFYHNSHLELVSMIEAAETTARSIEHCEDYESARRILVEKFYIVPTLPPRAADVDEDAGAGAEGHYVDAATRTGMYDRYDG